MYVPDANNRKLFDGGRDLTNCVRLTYKSHVTGPQRVTAVLKTCNFAWSHQPTRSKIYGIQIESLSSFFINKSFLGSFMFKMWMYRSDSMNAMWFDLHKFIKVRFYISQLITQKNCWCRSLWCTPWSYVWIRLLGAIMLEVFRSRLKIDVPHSEMLTFCSQSYLSKRTQAKYAI